MAPPVALNHSLKLPLMIVLFGSMITFFPELLKADSTSNGGAKGMNSSLPSEDYESALKKFYEKDRIGGYKNDIDGAIADLSHVIELDSKKAWVYMLRAGIKERKDDWNGAIADWNRAIELDPQNAECYERRAFDKAAIKDLTGSLADRNRVIELKPKDPGAYIQRAYFKETMKNSDGAIADYEMAVKLRPDKSNYIQLAQGKARKGDYDGAIATGYIAIKLTPQDAAIESNRFLKDFLRTMYFRRANAKKAKGDKEGAAADLKKSKEL
jgi:tetratricopeptide (TPR) repeat protein